MAIFVNLKCGCNNFIAYSSLLLCEEENKLNVLLSVTFSVYMIW